MTLVRLYGVSCKNYKKSDIPYYVDPKQKKEFVLEFVSCDNSILGPSWFYWIYYGNISMFPGKNRLYSD